MLFKLGDDSLENHRNERRVRTLETEISAVSIDETASTASEQPQNDEVELKIEASDDEETVKLEAVQEESEEMGQKVEAEQGDQIMFKKVAKLILEKSLLFVKR